MIHYSFYLVFSQQNLDGEEKERGEKQDTCINEMKKKEEEREVGKEGKGKRKIVYCINKLKRKKGGRRMVQYAYVFI